MVDHISIEGMQRIVGRMGPAVFIAGLAAEIEADYRRWSEFDKSARHAIYSPVGVIELIPTSDGQMYSFKYVNGHPKNTALGLLTVTAFGVLGDVKTGYPLLLSELTVSTALRTAAMSALAAKWMARTDGRVMALVGNGAQSEFQAIAFTHMLGIRELRLSDVDRLATGKLARNLGALDLPGVQLVLRPSVGEAVRGADIVTTVTADKRNATILTPEMIVPGMHLNAVGGDCPGKTEFAQRLSAAAGRASPAEVTIFDSVGFALEDYPALRHLHRLQREDRKGQQQIDLIPDLDNPKNLFWAAGPHIDPPAPAGCAALFAGNNFMTNKPIDLIGAPTDIGAGSRGASMGPEAMRVAGIRQALQGRGLTVHDQGNLTGPANPWLAPVDGYRHLAEVTAWNQAVHKAMFQSLHAGHFPILLGGDHCLGIGSISAVARHCRETGKQLRVLWLDAHADFNTNALTPTGNVHGMPVAVLCGHGPAALTGIGGVVPAMQPSAIRQIGIRSVDEGEKRFVRQAGLEVFDMRYIDEMGMRHTMQAALAGMDDNTHLHVSFDVDFLDASIAPGVGTTVKGGPTYREAQLCMEMIADTGRMASLDVMELNPALDVRNGTAEIAVDLIESLFGKSTLMRRH